MIDPDTSLRLARELEAAERSRVPVRQFSLRHPDMTVDDGYGIQRAWLGLKLQSGRALRGHKIGLTSRAMQQSSQIDEPDYGALLDDMFYESGHDIPGDRFLAPRVEVELAFVLGRPLRGPGVTVFDVLRAADYVVPALEIIDARIEQLDRESGRPRKVFDTISDNAASAGVVLGGRPVRPDALDLRWCGALLHKNGIIEESGLAAAVLGHPATGVAWLANKLARHGEALGEGEVVLAGSFTRPVAGACGDTFHADYGRLGSISFRFA
ncbi:2-oxo-hepta-3-ene-1,7-dioic acid hydratase [Pigmentiphaga sp. NML080357]|uniref:2-oxo-hept-4-ene-1,7-dioate hydratase n=1 Tax=Pigmentiphaga sp. NML080357 TaxID=2008675 RepID=UPI000B41AAC2|nr:2-oxo-hepta-3-ene-1,7-dioic acid hydratase [Pigmentiphaga sp. NML080357]OVZ56881.1 2-oxo-hepta-3-ene-1,7-dioic acid hydratase [Pigmentiphaga sp. NML080357]